MFEEVRAFPPLRWEFLEENAVIPLRRIGERLVVATWDEERARAVAGDLAVLFDCDLDLQQADERRCRAAIRRHYGGPAADMEDGRDAEQEAAGHPATHDVLALAHEPPVIQYVNLLLAEAVERRASDIHLESSADGVQVRLRIDGVLVAGSPPPFRHAAAVMSRVKIMADLDIAERRRAQDGRLRLRLDVTELDVRVSVMPLLAGESIVLRILDSSGGPLPLGQLGMSPSMMHRLSALTRRSRGMLLVAGPTGSGKTTTLYALLDQVRTGREKITTLEDPIEYRVPGVCQVPVNQKGGLDFASALRSVLRQDPDVILVGEVRDRETAVLAAQAALTGHLVLATVHSGDAAGALTRFQDLGVPPYLIASTVMGVLSQRLARRLCPVCGGPGREESCTECVRTGYRGRVGIFELLDMSETLRGALTAGVSTADVRALMARAGSASLADDAARHVADGTTDGREVRRVLSWID